MYKVILFDLDDTLIYFDDYWEESVKETFRQHHATKDLDCDALFKVYCEKDQYFGQKYIRQEISIQQFRNYSLMETLKQFGLSLSYENADALGDRCRSISRTKIKPNPTTLQTLEVLLQKYRLGIVTNGTTVWQHDKIEALGIKHLFANDSIFISEKIGIEKPMPGIYLAALEHFRVLPHETVFIGDSWQNDVLGPNRVGIPSIWFNRMDHPVPKNANLVAVIKEIHDLLDILIKNNYLEDSI